jgi:hypothetical protein
MTSCGSLTTAQVTDQLPSNEAAPPNIPRRQENVQCDISTQTTTPNWCNTSVRLLLFPLLLKDLSNYNLVTNMTQNSQSETLTGTIILLPSSFRLIAAMPPPVPTTPVHFRRRTRTRFTSSLGLLLDLFPLAKRHRFFAIFVALVGPFRFFLNVIFPSLSYSAITRSE